MKKDKRTFLTIRGEYHHDTDDEALEEADCDECEAPDAEEVENTEPVIGNELLEELVTLLRRYIVVSEHAAVAIALWIVFAHAIDSFQIAPILNLWSPVRRCGKTRTLQLLARLVPNAKLTSNITASALFRLVSSSQPPTLLIDEIDSFADIRPELRNVLNSGHERQFAHVDRAGPRGYGIRFSTWCPKVLALIGSLPDTVFDRSIRIEMRRKLPDEDIEVLRRADDGVFTTLADACSRYAEQNADILAATDPTLPSGLHDRAGDNWYPLLAIADRAGAEWPERARAAAVALSKSNDMVSMREDLLADIKDVFDDAEAERIHSKTLLEKLCALEHKPWATFNRGGPITERQVAHEMQFFGPQIQPKPMRIKGTLLRGYKRKWFEDAFSRYVLPSVTGKRTATKPVLNPRRA